MKDKHSNIVAFSIITLLTGIFTGCFLYSITCCITVNIKSTSGVVEQIKKIDDTKYVITVKMNDKSISTRGIVMDVFELETDSCYRIGDTITIK